VDDPGNQQRFETCIAVTLQVPASVEYGPSMYGEQPPRELLLEAAVQMECHATELVLMDQSDPALIQR